MKTTKPLLLVCMLGLAGIFYAAHPALAQKLPITAIDVVDPSVNGDEDTRQRHGKLSGLEKQVAIFSMGDWSAQN